MQASELPEWLGHPNGCTETLVIVGTIWLGVDAGRKVTQTIPLACRLGADDQYVDRFHQQGYYNRDREYLNSRFDPVKENFCRMKIIQYTVKTWTKPHGMYWE
jgi:hypothetical protein